MRPVRLELDGFLSYRDAVSIDLEGLQAVAIVGENGAGKSSLVDAISWALFGRGRGRGPDDYVSAGANDCRVRFEFDLDGGRYAVERQRQIGSTSKSYLGLFSVERVQAYVGSTHADNCNCGDGDTTCPVPEVGEELQWRPVGGDSIAETQAAIEVLLGMGADLWEATSFVGQGKADRFTQLTPAARKALLADLLDLDSYRALADKARELHRTATSSLDVVQAKERGLTTAVAGIPGAEADVERYETERQHLADALKVHEEDLESVRTRLQEAERASGRTDDLRSELDRLRADRRLVASSVDGEAVRIEQELHAADRELATTAEAVREAQMQASRLEELNEKHAIAVRAHAEAQRVHQAEVERQQSLERLAAEAFVAWQGLDDAVLERRLDALNEGEGRCFACEQALPDERRREMVVALRIEIDEMQAKKAALAAGGKEHRDAAKEGEFAAARAAGKVQEFASERGRLESDMARAAAAVEQIETFQTQAAAAEQRVERARAAMHDLADRRVAVREPSEREQEIERELAGAAATSTRMETFRDETSAISNAATLIRRDLETNARMRGGVGTVLEMLQKQAAELEALAGERERLLAAVTELAFIAEAFGRDGIPALIIDTAVPELEAEANRILTQITAERFTLRIESLKALKGGGTKESLEVVVGDDVSERPLEQLSGGERQCVDLALRISLARLLAHRAGRQIETLVIDEGFTALDTAHRQRTIEVLHGLLSEFRCVMFVTHLQELADAFPSRIQVVRGERGSHVLADEAVPV